MFLLLSARRFCQKLLNGVYKILYLNFQISDGDLALFWEMSVMSLPSFSNFETLLKFHRPAVFLLWILTMFLELQESPP